jgi:hypothetical protein
VVEAAAGSRASQSCTEWSSSETVAPSTARWSNSGLIDRGVVRARLASTRHWIAYWISSRNCGGSGPKSNWSSP